MDEISEQIDLCSVYAQMITEEGGGERDPRPETFWLIYNRLRVTQEILGFYMTAWSSDRMLKVDGDESDHSDEITDRLMTITKNLFVDVMSVIERGTMMNIGPYEKDLFPEQERRRYIYLRDVMRTSMNQGIISAAALQEWEDLLSIRNLVVHNNSISDRSCRLVIGDLRISMRPSRMMKGPMRTFVALSGRALSLYYHWMGSFDNRYRKDWPGE